MTIKEIGHRLLTPSRKQITPEMSDREKQLTARALPALRTIAVGLAYLGNEMLINSTAYTGDLNKLLSTLQPESPFPDTAAAILAVSRVIVVAITAYNLYDGHRSLVKINDQNQTNKE